MPKKAAIVRFATDRTLPVDCKPGVCYDAGGLGRWLERAGLTLAGEKGSGYDHYLSRAVGRGTPGNKRVAANIMCILGHPAHYGVYLWVRDVDFLKKHLGSKPIPVFCKELHDFYLIRGYAKHIPGLRYALVTIAHITWK